MYKLILIEIARRAIYIMIQEKDKFDLILSRWASGQSHNLSSGLSDSFSSYEFELWEVQILIALTLRP